jgi:hypothetical protein
VGDNIGHCERKFDTNACLTVSRYRRRIVWSWRAHFVRFLFVGLE